MPYCKYYSMVFSGVHPFFHFFTIHYSIDFSPANTIMFRREFLENKNLSFFVLKEKVGTGF